MRDSSVQGKALASPAGPSQQVKDRRAWGRRLSGWSGGGHQ